MTKQINKVKKFFKGFTLVELIIVIAIVAILSVSAFMTLTKWIGESRDSRRLSDIQTIKKSLTVNYADPTTTENYPVPDNAQTVTGDSGEKLWYQGYYGNGAAKNTASISKAPKDPSGTGYEYSTTTDQETYEVYAKLENGDKVSLIINKAYAKDSKYISKVGNYTEYLVGTNGSKYNLYNTPSLYITSGTQLTSGSNNNLYQEGKTTDSSVAVTGVDITNLKDDDTTNDDTVYDNIKNKFGLNSADESKDVVEKADGGNLYTANKEDNSVPSGGDFIFTGDNVSLSGGTEYIATSTGIILDITCASDNVDNQVKVAYGNSSSPTNWQSCIDGNYSHTLTNGKEIKTVYVRFKDSAGNISSDVNENINYGSCGSNCNIYGSNDDIALTLNELGLNCDELATSQHPWNGAGEKSECSTSLPISYYEGEVGFENADYLCDALMGRDESPMGVGGSYESEAYISSYNGDTGISSRADNDWDVGNIDGGMDYIKCYDN